MGFTKSVEYFPVSLLTVEQSTSEEIGRQTVCSLANIRNISIKDKEYAASKNGLFQKATEFEIRMKLTCEVSLHTTPQRHFQISLSLHI